MNEGRIPLARPLLGLPEQEATARVLDSGWLVQGPEVAAFEEKVAQACEVPYAVACSSGTAALHLALHALSLPPGSKVLVPAYTFPATINVVLLAGLRPVLVDVDEGTYNASPASVRAALSGDDGTGTSDPIAAMLAVHQFGLPAPLDALLPDLREREVLLVEDAACALGSTLQIDGARTMAGAVGVMGCFSFHPRKLLTTGEGGMVTCSAAPLDARLRRLRNHGMEAGPDGLQFVEAGFNYRLTEAQGAMGVVQMGRLAAVLADRARIAQGYRDRLQSLAERGLSFPRVPAGVTTNWQTVQVLVPARCALDAVLAAMRAEGVEVNFGAHALHQHPAYQDSARPSAGLRGAEQARARGLALPVPFGLTDPEMDRVMESLARAVR